MPAGRRLLSRRATLAVGAVGVLVVAGCDSDTDEPSAAPTPAEDLDGDLVAAVLEELADAERLAKAGGFTALSALHRAHIAALEGPEPTLTAARRTAAAVRRKEQHLQRHLAKAALEADSGALARLLASMSAAVAQRLAGDLA